ncbi:hypothetical protein [Devosia sp.]|uniref:hypothetical protein n=1 Tax=Devosia sp. TaxID=1871048 RepID=UPI002EEB254C
MHVRNLIFPLAAAAFLSVSGAATAQAVINNYRVPEESMTTFAQKCQALQVAQNRSLSEDADQTVTGSIDEPGESSGDFAAREHELEILASLTVEQCREAGFL